MRRSILLALLAASACSPPPLPAAPDLAPARLTAHLARIEPAATRSDTVRAASYAAEVLAQAGLQPAWAGSFLVEPAVKAPYVLGYVPGRDPRRAGELVLLSARLNDPAAAAAVLEVARVLAVSARSTLAPGRTVGVLLWTAEGPEPFLASPPWALDGVHAVLVVAEDPRWTAAERDRWAARGIAAAPVTSDAVQPASAAPYREAAVLGLAEAVLDAALTAAD